MPNMWRSLPVPRPVRRGRRRTWRYSYQMTAVRTLAKVFVKVDAPYFAVPRGAKRVAARIARDFTSFVEGVTIGYNKERGTSMTPEEGLWMLLDSDVDPVTLFDKYRVYAEQMKVHVVMKEWAGQDGFDTGWRWLTDDFAKWFVWNILDKPCKIDEFHEFTGAPLLRKALIDHPNGERWLCRFVAAFRGFLYPMAGDIEASQAARSKLS